MSNVTMSTKGPASRKPSPKRSKNIATIARWRTDVGLKIVEVTSRPDWPFRALPKVGQVVTGGRRRVGILRPDCHQKALLGVPTGYQFQLLRRTYRVDVAPRLNRGGKIIGVQATLTTVDGRRSSAPGGSHAGKQILTGRRTIKQAMRSLELAKTLAETARMNAELRNARALERQQRAEVAQARAEAAERRARFLADIGALLDASLDFRETMDRIGEHVVRFYATWCVLHLREGSALRRFSIHHQDPDALQFLQEVFPEAAEEDSSMAMELMLGRSRLFSSLTPEDEVRLAPTRRRLAALKELSVQSVIQVPVRSHGRMIGVLTIGIHDPGSSYDLEDLKLVQDLAQRIGLSRESSLLYAEAQREIAMRKEAEARLTAFNAELERRVRERTSLFEEATREANSFAYTVAHDLRAPLRAITGFCQALKEDYSAVMDAAGQDYLERIVTGARRMDDLIRDLLDYARVNRAEIHRTLVDLDQVFDEAMESMAAELRERKADVQRTRPLGRVMAHEPMLQQVITNLLSNAVKFVPLGTAAHVAVWTESPNGRVRLCVRDNGIGIAPEHQDRIFGIFERLNRAEEYPGTGIGLAIVRRAVERLGGLVGLESKPGQGSTFWIELPAP